MPTLTEYALMSGASYFDTRDEINRFPDPTDLTRGSRFPAELNNGSGFEASAFGNGTTLTTSSEIVISYAGTYDKDTSGDKVADVGLATGVGPAQLLQAAEYYLQVKAATPGASITLTGHSLGGGLAALVGVFFGVKAQTFDQAPFAKSAWFQAPRLMDSLTLYDRISTTNESTANTAPGVPGFELHAGTKDKYYKKRSCFRPYFLGCRPILLKERHIQRSRCRSPVQTGVSDWAAI